MTDQTPLETPFDTPDGMFMLTPEQAAVFNEPTRTDIMMLLTERPATTSQLADGLGKPKGTVGHHVKSLEDAGIIEVVHTRQVRAITEKYYGRLARTYVFPKIDNPAEDHEFLGDLIQEIREPQEGEAHLFTIRHARIPDDRAVEFALEIVALAEEFAAQERGGETVYGFFTGIYPTDRPSLKEQGGSE